MALSQKNMLRLGRALVDAVRIHIPESGNLHLGQQATNKLRGMRMTNKDPALRNHFLHGKGLASTQLKHYLAHKGLNEDQIYRADKQQHADGSYVDALSYREQSSKNALRYKIGNCGELTDTLLLALKYSTYLEGQRLIGQKITINRTHLQPDGDHTFAILYEESPGISLPSGRIDSNHLKALKNCVICDPWVWRASRVGNSDDQKIYDTLINAFGVRKFFNGEWRASYKVKPSGFKGSNIDGLIEHSNPGTFEPIFSSRHNYDPHSPSSNANKSWDKFVKYYRIFEPLVISVRKRFDEQ
jgi:hypothetical protein